MSQKSIKNVPKGSDCTKVTYTIKVQFAFNNMLHTYFKYSINYLFQYFTLPVQVVYSVFELTVVIVFKLKRIMWKSSSWLRVCMLFTLQRHPIVVLKEKKALTGFK